jgi:hypothetical protein
MSFIEKFRGGFMKPITTNDYTIGVASNVPQYEFTDDKVNTYRVDDDNTTYRSKLQPIIMGHDSSSFIADSMQLKIFWDQTTYTLPGRPGFIESPSDDYHPMPEIEFAEGASALSGNDRFVRTPHFVVKPDSTSQYYGKDRFDNYMTEPLSSFGGKFTWFDNRLGLTSTTKTTFNGGDIYGNERGLHMAFLYLKECMDLTSYQADLYYSRYSDYDGTFQNPVLLEQSIDVGGYGTPLETFKTMNRKTNPKFVEIPGVGLFINTLRSTYNTSRDTTEYYIDMKISRDDGTNWANYNRFPLNLFWVARNGTSQNMNMINDIYCPYMHWVYAESKLVCMMEFRDYRSTTILEEKEHLNLLVSENEGRTFKQANIDLSKIIPTYTRFGNSNYNRYILGSIHYDKKNSKFMITIGLTTINQNNDGEAIYGFAVIANSDLSLDRWEVILTENTGVRGLAGSPGYFNKQYNLGWNVSNFGDGVERYLHGHGPKFLAMSDEDNNSWIVTNCGISNRGLASTGYNSRGFDEFSDYSGSIPTISTETLIYSWTPTSLLFGLELLPATDSFLNQFRFATAPHRARKFSGSVSHRNRVDNGYALPVENNVNGIPPGQGATLSLYLDSIIENLDQRILSQPAPNVTSVLGNTSPLNTFYIQSFTRYKNSFWFLGTDSVLATSQENRNLDYQIPVLIHQPTWSNTNIKPRQNVYFTPMKHQDSTFVGWGRNAAETSEEIKTIFPPETKKYWEVKFARNQSAPGTILRCGLNHLSDTSAFVNLKGTAWDIDSTRGAFAHFICSVDSVFHRDTTSMVHILSVPTVTTPFNGYVSGNRTSLQTFIGKDHIAFRSTGDVATNFYAASTPSTPGNDIDTTRNLEFLVVVNRFRNLDSTHEHRAFFRYENTRDWTCVYFNLCKVGNIDAATAGFAPVSPGFMFGNIYRWPTSLAAGQDMSSSIYFKYHAEGWSAMEMHRFYPSNVSGVLTPSSDNLLSVLPQPCMHPKTFIPRGIQVGWAGQDATCGANFNIVNYAQKNNVAKILDDRPNISFRSAGANAATAEGIISFNIDFGKTISFDSLTLYNHNLRKSRFWYGQENNTTDLTAFLLLDQRSENIDQTNFENMTSFRQEKISNLDKDCILSYEEDFVKYVKLNKDKLNGKIFQFTGEQDTEAYFFRKLKYYEIWNDSSVYLEFESFLGYSAPYPADLDLTVLSSTSGFNFVIFQNKHLFQLSRKINARYIKITEDFESFPSSQMSPLEGYFYVGMMSFGNFQENENPIENGFKVKEFSPSAISQKYAGAGVSTLLTTNKRKSFDLQVNTSYNRSGGQYEQVDNFYKSIGGNRDNFYFAKNLVQSDGTFYALTGISSVETKFGYKKCTVDFFLVKNKGTVSQQKKNNNSTLSLTLEEVT